MTIIARIHNKNGTEFEQKISAYFDEELGILEIDEVSLRNGSYKLLGMAAGMDSFHCLYQASDCGRDLNFLTNVKYLMYKDSKNKDYPISIEFYC